MRSLLIKEKKISTLEDYNSHNTKRLNLKEMKEMLLKLQFIRNVIEGKPAEIID